MRKRTFCTVIIVVCSCSSTLFSQENLLLQGGDSKEVGTSKEADPAQPEFKPEITLDNLPILKWANDGFENLSWGIPRNQVEDILSSKLSVELEKNRVIVCSSNLETTWRRTRIKCETFVFIDNKLCYIMFQPHEGFEIRLIESLFDQFGPSRHCADSIMHQGCGSWTKRPYETDLPRKVISGIPANSKSGMHEYMWMDAQTIVRVSDQYMNANVAGRDTQERSALVHFIGWSTLYSKLRIDQISKVSPEYWERVAEDSKEFIVWANDDINYKKEHAQKLAKGNWTCICNNKGKCSVCDGTGLRDLSLTYMEPVCKQCDGKGMITNRSGTEIRCRLCNGKGWVGAGELRASKFKCVSCNGTAICPKCEGIHITQPKSIPSQGISPK
jgi:hypothetical protein